LLLARTRQQDNHLDFGIACNVHKAQNGGAWKPHFG